MVGLIKGDTRSLDNGSYWDNAKRKWKLLFRV